MSSTTNTHPSGLDINSITESYTIIRGLSPNVFQEKLVDSLELLLTKVYNHIKQERKPGTTILRILLIIVLVFV